MLLSKFFAPLIKENPSEASIKSHILMLRSGLVRQSSSGIYTWLPLGLRVLNKISNIIINEMNESGALNVLMPTLQSSDIWKESGRYDAYGEELLKITDRHKRELLYSPTNEEHITQIFRENVRSYKELPLNLYQVNWKFRDEIRPRFGVMRGREFLMKDAYSFDLTESDAHIAYKKMFLAYLRVFKTMGLQAIPMRAESGEIGGDLSHEFLILANTGESEVFFDERLLTLNEINAPDYSKENIEKVFNTYASYYAYTQDKHEENNAAYIENKEHIKMSRAIEVGHIFYFADKYSKTMNATVKNNEGQDVHVLMGSYGVGVSRLIGAIIEASSDDAGIIWPKSVSPFDVILNAFGNSDNVMAKCYEIYELLKANNIDVLFNDKDDSIGSKIKTADLLGIPYHINIGNKSLDQNSFEFKVRASNKVSMVDLNNIKEIITQIKAK